MRDFVVAASIGYKPLRAMIASLVRSLTAFHFVLSGLWTSAFAADKASLR